MYSKTLWLNQDGNLKKKYSNTKRTVKSYSWTFKSMKIIHALLELISLLF